MKRLLVVLLVACGGGDDGPTAPDAGLDRLITDFFGESCESAPPAPSGEAVVTPCRDGSGWCEHNVCRPICSHDADRCPGGAERRDAANVCYCVPL